MSLLRVYCCGGYCHESGTGQELHTVAHRSLDGPGTPQPHGICVEALFYVYRLLYRGSALFMLSSKLPTSATLLADHRR
ncbi:hypothetical protein Sjap_011142 [Stephania japonica]|uniref:Uncharacterized protein n=1 Tax=Stephania japonica TaxID=461633 RepID=A0AAP0JBV0_9MAGN